MVGKTGLKVVVLWAMAWLAGCQTTNPLENEFYSQSEQDRLPPIQLRLTQPSESLRALCAEVGDCRERPDLVQQIYYSLGRSDVFADILTEDDAPGYQVFLSVRAVYPSGIAERLALGAVAGATLLMTPVEIDRDFHCEWTLAWNGLRLGEYRYKAHYPKALHVFRKVNEDIQRTADYCASRFIHDVQSEGAFDPRNLFSKLKASDYQSTFQVPEQAGPYIYSSIQQFHHPLLGVSALYVDLDRPGAHANVFVYPIRRTEWQDVSTVIQNEILVALEDIDLLQQEGQVNVVDFEKPKPLLLENGRQGWQVQGRIQNLESEWYRSALYIFLQEDKFIKVRISEPEATKQEKVLGNELLEQLMAEIQVPAESLFMARMRQEQRKQQFD